MNLPLTPHRKALYSAVNSTVNRQGLSADKQAPAAVSNEIPRRFSTLVAADSNSQVVGCYLNTSTACLESRTIPREDGSMLQVAVRLRNDEVKLTENGIDIYQSLPAAAKEAAINRDDLPLQPADDGLFNEDEIDLIDVSDCWESDLDDKPATDDVLPVEEGVSLSAAYKKLCDELQIAAVSYFKRHVTDHVIRMRYHGLNKSDIRAIATTLKDSVTLTKLDLTGNGLDSEAGLHLSQLLEQNKFITELILTENYLGSLGCYYIMRMLHDNNVLRHLDLSGNNLCDRDAHHVAQALKHNRVLVSLVLSRNRFGNEAANILGPVIADNDVLRRIDLSWNEFRKSGGIKLAKGLQENSRLETCSLAWNGLGPDGALAIGEMLSINDTLKDFDISGNRLDDKATVHIAKALTNNNTLQTLKIGSNPITCVGCSNLATALKLNDSSSLCRLDLMGISVGLEFVKMISDLQKYRDLQVSHE